MLWHIFDSHISSCEPFIWSGHFPIKIQTCSHYTPSEEARALQVRSFKFQAHFQFEHYGKILERLTLARLLPHLPVSPSFSPLQSAYRKFHSTETALLKLTNDIMDTIDSGKVTILAALDMSAAFDTLDHTTLLLNRLEHTFGLSGTVHTWIHSYLTNRSSSVKIDSSSSFCDTSLTGVLQVQFLALSFWFCSFHQW